MIRTERCTWWQQEDDASSRMPSLCDVLPYPPRYPGFRPPPPSVHIMSAKEEGEQEAEGLWSGKEALRSSATRATNAWIAPRSLCREEKSINDSGACDAFDVRTTPRNLFSVGKVFFVSWAEETGNTVTSPIFSKSERSCEEVLTRTRLGNKVFSKIRRFIIVGEGKSSFTAIPIQTYSGNGVGTSGVIKSEHAIIHTRHPITPILPNERMVRPPPISVRIDSDNCSKLDAMSRLSYAEVCRLPSFSTTCTAQFEALSCSWGGDSNLKINHGRQPDIGQTPNERYYPNSWSTPDHVPEFIPAARCVHWVEYVNLPRQTTLYPGVGIGSDDLFSYFSFLRVCYRDLAIVYVKAIERVEGVCPCHHDWNKYSELKCHEKRVHSNYRCVPGSLLFDRGVFPKRLAPLQRVMTLVERWMERTLSSLTPGKAGIFIAALSRSCVPRAFGQIIEPAGLRSGNSSPLLALGARHLIVRDSTGSDGLFIVLLSGFLCELLVAYKLRPFDRYKSRAMGTCMLTILLICGFYASNMRQVVLFEWLGLNLTLVISAAFHASFGARTAGDEDEDDNGVTDEKTALLGKSG